MHMTSAGFAQQRRPGSFPVDSSAPAFSLAGHFLEALALRDFDRLADLLAPAVELRALLPRGHDDWVGAVTVAERFRGWFGDTEEFELLDATIGQTGGRVHLHWRIRLRARRLGSGDFIIEQQAYVDPADSPQLTRIDLLCSGFRPVAGRSRAGSPRARSAGMS
jgi:hypothetical protein